MAVVSGLYLGIFENFTARQYVALSYPFTSYYTASLGNLKLGPD